MEASSAAFKPFNPFKQCKTFKHEIKPVALDELHDFNGLNCFNCLVLNCIFFPLARDDVQVFLRG